MDGFFAQVMGVEGEGQGEDATGAPSTSPSLFRQGPDAIGFSNIYFASHRQLTDNCKARHKRDAIIPSTMLPYAEMFRTRLDYTPKG
ncbi:hypothetical protein BGW39_003410 [Mortierella sp. 14UC]|nr:hypothetical protein BGW39_003410 [Mortierella sp. 14UC]